jgi:nucleoside-diphosphate-sugar epimerase
MKVLVTGGTGFIGSWTVQRLIGAGHTPVVFDRRKLHHTPRVDDVEWFLGDMTDDVSVTEALAHVDAFIHLAGVLGTQETILNPRPAAMSNLKGGLNVLEAASQYDVPGVYIGVGNHWMNNTYSISKTMIERFVDMFNNHRGTTVNIVRAMNAYGPRQSVAPPYGSAKVRKITPSFVCRAIMGSDIEIYGDGDQISDMVWVGDVAEALWRAMERAVEGCVLDTPVEVGPAENNTVNEVAELIVKLTGSTSKIKHLPMRPGEVPGAVVMANVGTMEQIGMDPDKNMVPLEDGMRQTIDYYRTYLRQQGYK